MRRAGSAGSVESWRSVHWFSLSRHPRCAWSSLRLESTEHCSRGTLGRRYTSQIRAVILVELESRRSQDERPGQVCFPPVKFLIRLAKMGLQSHCAAASLQTHTRSTSTRALPQGERAVDRGGERGNCDGTSDGMAQQEM